MRITFVGHASILIETCGLTILSDPWWRGPCFGAQWWNYPAPHLEWLKHTHVDYIYVSHGHHDHFHPGTLSTLSRNAKVLVSKRTDLAPFARELGFECIEIGDDEVFNLGAGVTGRIMETHSNDTLMALSDGREVCLNLNDALHAAPHGVQTRFVERLKSLYPRVDYVYCGYGTASHFPNCYIVPGTDRSATAAARQRYFNREWAKLIAQLNPRFGFPFAADVALLEDDLFWVNEPAHNAERPVDAFRASYPESTVQTFDIAPGFVIEDGDVKRNVLRRPLSNDELKQCCAEQIARANRCLPVSENTVSEVARLVKEAVQSRLRYLQSYNGDYKFLLRFKNCVSGISIAKNGTRLEVEITSSTADQALKYDIIYTTRVSYLKWCFTRPYGDEILFVGSGGVFEYADTSRVHHNLHRELIAILRAQRDAQTSERPRPSKFMSAAKRAIKSLIGHHDASAAVDPHLYDLARWTAPSADR
jgi:hypothetical protein